VSWKWGPQFARDTKPQLFKVSYWQSSVLSHID